MRTICLILSVSLITSWAHAVTDHHVHEFMVSHIHHDHDDGTSHENEADFLEKYASFSSPGHHVHDEHMHFINAILRSQDNSRVSSVALTLISSLAQASNENWRSDLFNVHEIESRIPIDVARILTTVLRR